MAQEIRDASGRLVRTITDLGGGTLRIANGRGEYEGFTVKK